MLLTDVIKKVPDIFEADFCCEFPPDQRCFLLPPGHLTCDTVLYHIDILYVRMYL